VTNEYIGLIINTKSDDSISGLVADHQHKYEISSLITVASNK
jgi:hypothetical protein